METLTLKMDPLLTEMCEFYEEMWRKNNPAESHLLNKTDFIKNFLTALFSRGKADLVEDENGQAIWKATKKLVCELGPELGQLQPSPAPDLPQDIGFYDKH
jgi:hypothetical protein